MRPISACYTSGRGNSLNRALFELRPLHYKTEVAQRINQAKIAFWKKATILKSNISMKTRIRILMCYVFSVLSYGCETWTYSKAILLLLLLNFITDSLLHICAGKYDSCPKYKHYNKDTTLQTTDIVISYSVLHAMNIKQPPPVGTYS